MTASPTHLYDDNVELSIFRVLSLGWVASVTYPVYFDDYFADPQNLRALTAGTDEQKWATAIVLDNKTGAGGVTLVQLDFYFRVGSKAASPSARFNAALTGMVRGFKVAMVNYLGSVNRTVPVYDFSSDASNPTLTRGLLEFLGEDGRLAMGAGTRRMPTLDGTRRQTVTLRVRHTEDRPSVQRS